MPKPISVFWKHDGDDTYTRYSSISALSRATGYSKYVLGRALEAGIDSDVAARENKIGGNLSNKRRTFYKGQWYESVRAAADAHGEAYANVYLWAHNQRGRNHDG